MRTGLAVTLTFFASAAALQAAPAGVRSLFLNGVDISSARGQDLKNVDVHINDAGDVFIIAPHYQVNEEDTYVPLSKYVQGLNQPAHKAPQKLGDDGRVGGAQQPQDMVPGRERELASPVAAKSQIPPDQAQGPSAGGAPAVDPADAPPGTPVAAPAGGVKGELPKAGDPVPMPMPGGDKG